MKYEVIDNFLDEEYFKTLEVIFTDAEGEGSRLPWFFVKDIVYHKENENWKSGEEDDKVFFMFNMVYYENCIISNVYKTLIPLINKLNANLCLLRIKSNLYPNTHKLHEHQFHTDFDFPHSGAILSLNTCDGYTKLKDGTKIDSVANRILLFDSSEEHCSTSTTNVPARFNININYIQTKMRF